MKKLIYIFLLALIPTMAFPSHGDKNKNISKTISGKVSDAYGEAIPGTKIKIKETGETFFADFEGQFKFSIPSDKTYSVVIETIGFEALELKSSDLGLFSELNLKAL